MKNIFQPLPEQFKDGNNLADNGILEMLEWFADPTKLEKTFFELNVDASLTEDDVVAFFDPLCKTARRVSDYGALLVVFLDGKFEKYQPTLGATTAFTSLHVLIFV